MAGYIGSGASVVSSGAENKKVFDITTNTTSLTGLNYTVGKVHVYHNGVRLVDGTDFTATNSTSIALTVAAVSGDQVVVVSYASYQVALSGIDDQSNATALTIDSSENVLIGKAVTNLDTAGITLGESGFGSFTRSGYEPLNANRLSSDGAIAKFYKDSTTVGSIGTLNGYTKVVSGNGTAGSGLGFYNYKIEPVNPNGNASDDEIDLGVASNRFKDLYLSGGIYLGGVGSANKLDDYESGTFTPTPNTGTFTLAGGKYTKVGNLVTLAFDITVGTGGATQMAIPFSCNQNASSAIYTDSQNFANGRTTFYGVAAGSNLIFRVTGDNIVYTSGALDSSVTLHGSITYQTDD